MRVEKGSLAIRNGYTHFPQVREEHRLFKGDRSRPPRIIMIDGSGTLSFDVLAWLCDQDIPLVRIGWQGEAIAIVGGSGSALVAGCISWQDAIRADPTQRLHFCCDLIAEKVANSITTLRTAVPDTPARAAAINSAERTIRELQLRLPTSVMAVQMTEAKAASAYFRAWRGLPLRWKGLRQHPVPDTWLVATARRSYTRRLRSTSRHASHPLNAMLNYAYAVLHSQVQAELVGQGYDPARGVMHESRPDSRAFVLDMIEPRRPIIEAAILKLVSKEALSGADFLIRSDGVCRLAPQLARHVAVVAYEATQQASSFAQLQSL